jgi:hypothetical protein
MKAFGINACVGGSMKLGITPSGGIPAGKFSMVFASVNIFNALVAVEASD